jgi:hypothetical protein
MKAVVAAACLLVLAFIGFAYFHSKSVDRAWLVHAKSALLSAQKKLADQDAISSGEKSIYVERRSDQMKVGEDVYEAQLAAHISGYTNAGYLLITTNNVFIWMDKKDGPMIIDGPGFPHATPPRFRDF